jgi:hypothetical protein
MSGQYMSSWVVGTNEWTIQMSGQYKEIEDHKSVCVCVLYICL